VKRTPLRRLTGLSRRVGRLTTRRKPSGFDQQTKARVLDRDGWACALCGATRLLVVHHRRNRGAGGSSDPDTSSVRNGLTLCAGCNMDLEHDPTAAALARQAGVKLRHGQPLTTPVRYPDGRLWLLREDGTRRPVNEAAA